MSQEIGKKPTEVRPPVPSYGTTDEKCVLSVALDIVGIVTIILSLIGVVITVAVSYEPNVNMLLLYLIGGTFAALQCFALSVIVDACQKYRRTHKG